MDVTQESPNQKWNPQFSDAKIIPFYSFVPFLHLPLTFPAVQPGPQRNGSYASSEAKARKQLGIAGRFSSKSLSEFVTWSFSRLLWGWLCPLVTIRGKIPKLVRHHPRHNSNTNSSNHNSTHQKSGNFSEVVCWLGFFAMVYHLMGTLLENGHMNLENGRPSSQGVEDNPTNGTNGTPTSDGSTFFSSITTTSHDDILSHNINITLYWLL